MRIMDQIKDSAEEDLPILLWLAAQYPSSHIWQSGIIAKTYRVRYGAMSYQVHIRWSPTAEGRILYENRARILDNTTKKV